MIEFKTGNIFDEKVEALVNTVNCVGVMGKGLALEFKKKYPYNFLQYAAACKDKEVVVGKMFITKTKFNFNPKYIINFPTKKHWMYPSKIQYIISGLIDLNHVVNKLHIHSIAIPPLGCGLGGLGWEEVRPLIESAFSDSNVQVIIFNPGDKK